MENLIVRETTNILKELSPENQSYLLTLAKVAEAAEKGVKKQQGIENKTA